MKVLIIGYGSIGRRHEEILSSFDEVESIDIVTKQNIDKKNIFNDINKVNDLASYDYFIIASETYKHYEQLKYLETNVTDKIIFCEKPLFENSKDLKINKNHVFVGYVLRFHPILQKLRTLLKNQKVLSVHVNCGQYLPTWRQNTDYRKSYSAKKDEGGGVLLDLSHEVDYIQWLFGIIKEIKSYQLKISDLEIDTDDITTLIGKTDKETIINLSIDYISKITYRRVLLHTLNYTYELDFIENRLIQKDKVGVEQVYTFINLKINHLFEQMHKSILSHKESVCSYNEGLKVMNTISIIQEQNK